ncbi:increased DNA methylation 1-like [Bidens hawaiensis]|uniref:increased DNA methylation 1-like n=1 Tax=Bidens hawaiensis TaxID=980011 RepID=UPI00404B6CFF
MHECFQPIKHKWSNNDLVEDLVFGRSSSRSNLKGFFTAVLEKDDEMIKVATLRVHGGKVAEIPLVATRFRYRRLGMCSVLMGEIERKLGDLGVERLVLPAVKKTEMVSTWTTSFGFKVMNEDERVELVAYKLVDFPGTRLKAGGEVVRKKFGVSCDPDLIPALNI